MIVCLAFGPAWTDADLLRRFDWEQGLNLAHARFKELGRCWACYSMLTDAGACPKKGCRGPATGFAPPRPLPEPAPCLDCGEPTQDRYAGSTEPEHTGTGEMVSLDSLTRCASCRDKRWLEQCERVARNEVVLPKIREWAANRAKELREEL